MEINWLDIVTLVVIVVAYFIGTKLGYKKAKKESGK
jgi:hypothetical protein